MKNNLIKLGAIFALTTAIFSHARADEKFSFKDINFEWTSSTMTLVETKPSQNFTRVWDFLNNTVTVGQTVLPADKELTALPKGIRPKLRALLAESIDQELIAEMPREEKGLDMGFFAGIGLRP